MNKENGNFKKERGKINIIFVGAVLFLFLGIINTFLKLENTNPDSLALVCTVTITALEKYEAAVFLPGAGSNPTRHELNTILEDILTKEMSEKERLSRSLLGLEKVEGVHVQIDEIQKTDLLLNKAVHKLEDNIPDLTKKDREGARLIVSLIKKYRHKASEVKRMLYIINNNTKEIFERTVDEKGKLSEEHIAALNEQIPEAEINFDSLSFLYRDLISIKKDILETY